MSPGIRIFTTEDTEDTEDTETGRDRKEGGSRILDPNSIFSDLCVLCVLCG